MTVPSRVEAAAVLLALRPSPRLLRHSTAVAEIAAFLAWRIAERGIAVDRRAVESAALLHDMDKALPADDPVKSLGHGDAGAQWLIDHGFGELSRAVANHPVTRLSDEDRYRRWASFASREERIVAYADKRAAQRLGPMDARFARWKRRHPEYRDGLVKARERADRLEQDVCKAAGVTPSEVRRLPWVARAIVAAKRAR